MSLAAVACALRGHTPDPCEVFLAAPPEPPGPHLFYAYTPYKLRRCSRCGVFVELPPLYPCTNHG